MNTSVPMGTTMTRHRLDQVPALDGVASMMVSQYSKREAWSHRSVLDEHENSKKENPWNREPKRRNREPGCIYTIEYWIQLNMRIVRVAHFSFTIHVERQLCIVNWGYAIVTKQQWGDGTNKFCSTVSADWHAFFWASFCVFDWSSSGPVIILMFLYCLNGSIWWIRASTKCVIGLRCVFCCTSYGWSGFTPSSDHSSSGFFRINLSFCAWLLTIQTWNWT
jgi:hypothetical protein